MSDFLSVFLFMALKRQMHSGTYRKFQVKTMTISRTFSNNLLDLTHVKSLRDPSSVYYIEELFLCSELVIEACGENPRTAIGCLSQVVSL